MDTMSVRQGLKYFFNSSALYVQYIHNCSLNSSSFEQRDDIQFMVIYIFLNLFQDKILKQHLADSRPLHHN